MPGKDKENQVSLQGAYIIVSLWSNDGHKHLLSTGLDVVSTVYVVSEPEHSEGT